MQRVLTDSLLAAWLTGAAKYARTLPDPTTQPTLGGPPPPPDLTGPLVSAADEGEPLVRFPQIEAAARDLAQRQVMRRVDFDQLADEAKRAAFTVARVQSLDALEKLQRALSEDVAVGGTLRSFRKRVDEALGESALSAGHVETVYRTNVAAAHVRGLMESLAHPLVSDEFPYLEYVAVHDSRTRPEHLEMESLGIDGTNVYRRDDPIWQKFLPPWDYQCRCSVIPLTIEDAASRGVGEARDWLRSGMPPTTPAWVKAPPFSPPPGWVNDRVPAFV